MNTSSRVAGRPMRSPMRALRPSGLSSATTLPSLRTVIRPQRRSASARSCVVRTMVASTVVLISSMNAWTSSFERGSRPVVGSSRSSRDGLVSRARAIATFCCIPRLICSRGRLRRFSLMPRREDQVLHRAELLEEGGVATDPVDQALDRHLLALDVVAEDLYPALVEGQ